MQPAHVLAALAVTGAECSYAVTVLQSSMQNCLLYSSIPALFMRRRSASHRPGLAPTEGFNNSVLDMHLRLFPQQIHHPFRRWSASLRAPSSPKGGACHVFDGTFVSMALESVAGSDFIVACVMSQALDAMHSSGASAPSSCSLSCR